MADSSLRQFQESLRNYDGGGRRWSVLGPKRKSPQGGGSGRRRRRRVALRFPFYSVILVLSLFFLMKAFIVLRLGEDRYLQRLAAVDETAFGARIGIFAMTLDPVSLALRDLARPIIGGKRP